LPSSSSAFNNGQPFNRTSEKHVDLQVVPGSDSGRARVHGRESIGLSEQIQEEDVAICASVQRGLRSRAYDAGRLSVRRESGDHPFHRLLCDDLTGHAEA
jgi:Ring hydroxylating alpha subunit (catalytic domain)